MKLSAAQESRGLAHTCNCHRQPTVVNPRATAAAASRHVVGFVAIKQEKETQLEVSELLDAAGVVTLKERVMQTAAFKQFQQSVENKPSLQSDWLSFTSRPWVQGPVDAFLGNTHLAAMMSQHQELAVTVEGLVQMLDTALMKGGHVPWLLRVVQHCAGHSGMYVIMQAVEEMLGPHHIARLERLTYAALTRPRAVKLMAVLVALLTPDVVEDLVRLTKALLTDDRLTRLMNAAEYVVSEDDRMSLAALALDSLSDAVSDESILHFIAVLDTEADLQLIIRTGQEVLEVLLQDPEGMGQRIGSLVDAVVDIDRLERTVLRNDEVMTLERIAVMHKVLAQISPAGSPQNITAGISALRTALTSHSAHSWLSAASSAVSFGELQSWWQAFDGSLTTRHINSVLDAVEALLDGGRIWALLGQPQPALEMLLIADEEARAATCRSKCGTGSGSDDASAAAAAAAAAGAAIAAPSKTRSSRGKAGASRKLSPPSRDEWTVSSLASYDDAGTASANSGSSSSGGRGSLSAAAAAAAAAANAAAEAASVAPACALDDHDCQDCTGRCGSPVERAFIGGSQLSDPDLSALIRTALRDIRPYRLAKQRAAAQLNAQQAMTSAAAAAGGSGDYSHTSSSFDDYVSNSSILASLDFMERYAPGSPLASMHLGTGALPTGAQENAGTAAAAAVAVAAAAAASQGGTCSFASSPTRDLTLPALKVTPVQKNSSSSSSSSSAVGDVESRLVRTTVQGAAGIARAAFKPQRLRSFFDLTSELLSPQRVAIAMAVLDNVLRIGEHSVAVGPVCEINVPAGSSSSTSNDRRRGGSNGGVTAAATAALALAAAVPGVVLQRLIDAAVGAAADVASGAESRKSVLHMADTMLALATLQQEVQLRKQQQQQGVTSVSPPSAAAAVPGHQLEQAAAVMHCALGDPHPCVTAEELAGAAAAAAGGGSSGDSSGRNGNRVTPKWQLMVTLMGLHVTLLKDLGSLWWAYHTRAALNLAGRSRPLDGIA